MLERIHEAGFEEITFGQVAIFRAAGPHGLQPKEIAAQAHLSKQTVNDALRQHERLGHLTLVPHPRDGRARVVRLTARGRRLDAVIWEAGRAVEREWRERLGPEAWDAFVEVLDVLAPAGAQEGAV